MRRTPLALPLLLAACVPAARMPPPAAPPASVIRPTSVVPPSTADWQDVPLTPGAWRYLREGAGSVAAFGPSGVSALVELRCDLAQRTVSLTRFGPNGGALTIRTSYGERIIPPRSAAADRVSAIWAASDPFLDRIAFSRGRISVAGPGVAPMYLPAWAEPARVIEDCRG